MEIGAGVTPGCCLFNGRQSRRRQCWRALFDDIVAIEVLGPMTLHFRLQQPNASLLACLATFPAWLISPGALRDHGEALQQIPVGTGPYRFVSWYPGETISLERPLRLSTFTAPRIYFPDPVRVASLIRDDLQRVGIPVEIVSRDFQSHLTAVRNGEQLVVWRSDISGFVAHPTGEIRLGPVLRNEPGP